jgi:hypothetical protein
MIGCWVDKEDNVDVKTECQWTKNQSFITRSFTVAVRGEINMSGMQIIGWDPAAKTIRSWTFDSDGGFAEATWTCKKDRWFIRNKGILADGRKASMVNAIKQVDQNAFTWQTVERTAGKNCRISMRHSSPGSNTTRQNRFFHSTINIKIR